MANSAFSHTFTSSSAPGRAENQATEDILNRLGEDSDESWEDLYARLDSKLRILAAFRLSQAGLSGADADDLLQEVWMDTARNLNKFHFRGPGSLHKWMAGILRNKILHWRRTCRRKPLVSPDSLPASEPVHNEACVMFWEALEKSQTGVSHMVRQQELEERIRNALSQLPDELREVVLLRVYEGWSGREIAAQLRVHESSVTRKFKQALQACAGELGDLC